jgi:F0F1-type ATP synthase assembly protein I
VPPDPERARRKAADEREEMRIGLRMMGLAWAMLSEVLAGAGIGWLVDHFWGTSPTGMTIGASVGILVAMYSLVRGGLSMNAYLEGKGRRVERGDRTRPDGSKEDADG